MTILPTPEEIRERAAIAAQRERTRREHGHHPPNPTLDNRPPIEPKTPAELAEINRRYRVWLDMCEIRKRMGYPYHNAHLREERQFAPGYPPLQIGGLEDAKGQAGLWLDGGRLREVIHWGPGGETIRWHEFGREPMLPTS